MQTLNWEIETVQICCMLYICVYQSYVVICMSWLRVCYLPAKCMLQSNSLSVCVCKKAPI